MIWLRPMRSFRGRITLLAIGTSVLCIAVLSCVSLFSIVERRHEVFDRIQRSHLATPALQFAHLHGWEVLESQLDSSLSGFSETPPSRPRVLLLVQDEGGRTMYRSRYWPAQLDGRLPAPVRTACGASARPDCSAAQVGKLPLHKLATERDEWRIGAVDAPVATGTWRKVWVVVNWSVALDTMLSKAGRFGLATMPLFAVLGITAWLLAGRAMRPLNQLNEAMRKINANARFEHLRLADEAHEFTQLVHVFNDMVDRLQRSFVHAIRFSGDAAHELKTPLTILQGELERCFERAGNDPELEESLSRMLEEVRGLDSIVRKLLLLSRADAGQLQLLLLPIDLRPMLADLAEDIGMLAPISADPASLPAQILVRGDRELLGQVLKNLVSNALKYRQEDGWICLSAVQDADVWHIDVANASEGIPPEQRERLFERFYRADAAHSRRIPGVGLGLALAREIAHAHMGRLSILPAVPGQETFRLTLPAG